MLTRFDDTDYRDLLQNQYRLEEDPTRKYKQHLTKEKELNLANLDQQLRNFHEELQAFMYKKFLRDEKDYASKRIYPWWYKKPKKVSFNLDENSTMSYTDWESVAESSNTDHRQESF